MVNDMLPPRDLLDPQRRVIVKSGSRTLSEAPSQREGVGGWANSGLVRSKRQFQNKTQSQPTPFPHPLGGGSERDSKSHNRPRAFALVDVVIAGMILAIGLGAILSLSGRSITAAQRGEELATAAMLADEQLNMVLARGPDDYARRFGLEGVCDEPFTNYRYRLEFAGGRSVGEVYDVRVTIEWGGGAGGTSSSASAASNSRNASQSLTISTLIAPREIGEDVEVDPDRRPEQSILRGAGVSGAGGSGGSGGGGS